MYVIIPRTFRLVYSCRYTLTCENLGSGIGSWGGEIARRRSGWMGLHLSISASVSVSLISVSLTHVSFVLSHSQFSLLSSLNTLVMTSAPRHSQLFLAWLSRVQWFMVQCSIFLYWLSPVLLLPAARLLDPSVSVSIVIPWLNSSLPVRKQSCLPCPAFPVNQSHRPVQFHPVYRTLRA